MTSVYLLGWIVSIYWGYIIVVKSSGDHNEIKQLINAGNAGGNAAANGGQSTNATNSIDRRDSGRRRPNNPYDD